MILFFWALVGDSSSNGRGERAGRTVAAAARRRRRFARRGGRRHRSRARGRLSAAVLIVRVAPSESRRLTAGAPMDPSERRRRQCRGPTDVVGALPLESRSTPSRSSRSLSSGSSSNIFNHHHFQINRQDGGVKGWQGRGGSLTRAPRPATPGKTSDPRPAIPSDPGRPARPGHLSGSGF